MRMSSAATIIFAREDLSIPGAAENAAPGFDRTDAAQDLFFELVDRARPDVIVLDLSRSPANGTETILTIREQTDTPILVVCNPEPLLVHDYRTAGAADCIAAPIDIICLHQAIQHIMRVRGGRRAIANGTRRNFAFAGMTFYPERNLLAAKNGLSTDLTSSEGRLLGHFLSKPRALCTRSEIAELLYGPQPSVGERAIDVVVTRLRKKLVSAGGDEAEKLIRTEFRRGYALAAEVASLPQEPPAPRHPQ